MKQLIILVTFIFPGLVFASEVNDFDLTISRWRYHLQVEELNQDKEILGFRYKQCAAFTLVSSYEYRAYGTGWYTQ
ncbi:hypothetical protein BCU66_003575 [Vibrio sp. 10N.286.49.B1]|uniref:hypothetical protein n=1 Tax=unclassified Vibrio TaxID=2614977 RepID=UPI0010568D94|nr:MULTISPECIES: hypothetical protein [unclassified Vibrio]